MQLAREIRVSLRSLGRTPAFFAFATLLLTAGIGLSLYIFSAVNGFVLRPLPFRGADRLVHVELADLERHADSLEAPVPDYFAMRDGLRSVSDLAAFYSATVNLGGDGDPERLEGEFVSANLFEVFGFRSGLGRTLRPEDEVAGAPPVAVLSHEVWQRRYAGDASIVGRSLRLNGTATTIVGVMPPGFDFPQRQEIWLPITRLAGAAPIEQASTCEVAGHLAGGASIATARAEVDALLARLAAADSSRPAKLAGVVKPFAEEFVSARTRTTLTLMLVAVLLVLLIACADVANLLLVRGLARRRDVAVRAALGASRRTLVVRGLVEGGLVVICASALGLALADWGGRRTMEMLRAAQGVEISSWISMRLDGRMVLVTLFVASLTTLLAALGPALAGSRVGVLAELRGASRGTAHGRLGRASRVLVVGQIALSVALVACAGLAVHSVQRLAEIPVGVDADHILGVRVGLFEGNYPDDASRLAFFARAEQKLRELPGVADATVTSSLPASFIGGLPLEVDGKPLADFGGRRANIARVTPSYFSTMQMPIVAGRALAPADDANGELVAVVNQSLVRYFFGQEDPLGHRVRFASKNEPRPWLRIVGVVPDIVQDEVDEGIKPAFYVPMAQDVQRFAFLAVRAGSDPHPLGPAIAKAITEIDPDQPVYWARTVSDWVRIGSFMNSFLASLFSGFAVAGLLLAGAGLYGVLAFTVSSRTSEIGLRRALGAADRGIVAWIARGSLRDLAIGLGVGALLAAALARPLAGMFYGVSALDPATWMTIPFVLALATAGASLVPTLRALRVEPAVALRDE